MHSEVAGTTFLQNIVKGQRTKVGHHAGRRVRKTDRMMKRKIRSPFNMNISGIICAIRLEVGCYQHELFLNQQVYL